MISTVLNSNVAIAVNIRIIRIFFICPGKMLLDNHDILLRMDQYAAQRLPKGSRSVSETWQEPSGGQSTYVPDHKPAKSIRSPLFMR